MAKRDHGSSDSELPIKRKPINEDDDSSIDSLIPYRAETSDTKVETGIIIEVSLRNFMFHECLEFKFGERVNFIIGKNGSGKSAVQTAIVVALGGKAAATGRGSSVKNFIKHGKHSSTVMVRLKNTGSDAYKFETYGESIIVERRIIKDGTSSYTLKDHKGVTVTKKKEELDHILDQFNIQIDNPVVIMSQDTSRNFLPGTGPQQKYQFFKQGTQLQQIEKDYQSIENNVLMAQEIIERKEKSLQVILKELKAWETKYNAITKLDSLRENVDILKHTLAWAHVAQREKDVELAIKDKKIQESRIPKFTSRVEESEAKLLNVQKNITDIQEKLNCYRIQFGDELSVHKRQKNLKQNKANNVRHVTNDLKKLQNEMTSYQREKRLLENKISEIKDTAHVDYERQCRKHREEIERLKEQTSTLEAQKLNSERQSSHLSSASNQLKQELYKARSEEQQLKNALHQQKRLLDSLKNAENDNMNKYGSNMRDVIHEIEHQRNQFHKLPRGPLGIYITLKDKRWAVSVERCLSNLMLSFACHDHHDEQLLERIFRKFLTNQRKPAIITSAFLDKVHDYKKGHIVHPAHPCVIDVLNVSDQVVLNTLIDQRRIETIMLFDDPKVAKQTMSRAEIPKLSEAFTISGDQLYAIPTYRYYSLSANFKVRYLSTGVQEDIRQAEHDLQKIQTDLNEIIPSLKKMERQMSDNQVKDRQCQKVIDHAKNKIMSVVLKIHELQNTEIQPPPDIDAIEQDVENATTQIKRLEERIQQQRDKLKNAEEDYKESQEEYLEVDNKLKQISDKTDQLNDELSTKENSLVALKGHKAHYEKKLKELNKAIKDCEKVVIERHKIAESDTEVAKSICEVRIHSRRTPQNLSSEIEQIQRRISAESKIRGSREDIMRTYEEKRAKYREVKMEIDDIKIFVNKLGLLSRERQKTYKQFEELIEARVKYFFILLLNNRNFTGKISFNDRKYLTFSVNTKSHKTKDMKALSGGEKSFTTICFILALWDIIECPFRCLDEFDVYQDMVNRRISLDMILSMAGGMTSSQFLFLTPQPMNIAGSSNVKIFKMADPERRRKHSDDENSFGQ